MSRVADKVVLVTGAGSGIGRATAKLLAAEGATVIVTDINKPGGLETVQQIGGKARFEEHDTSQRGRLEAHHRRHPGARGQAERAGQQCRHLRAFPGDLRDRDGRAVAAHAVGQRPGRVPRLQARRAGDAAVGRRLDREHLVAGGLSRHADAVGLWRQQGRGAAVHQDRGDGLRAQGLQDALQFGASRHHHDADGPGRPAQRQGARAGASSASRSANSARPRTSPMASST